MLRIVYYLLIKLVTQAQKYFFLSQFYFNYNRLKIQFQQYIVTLTKILCVLLNIFIFSAQYLNSKQDL